MQSGEPMTAEDLERLSLPEKRTELVRGVLVVREPAGARHGALAARIAYRIMAQVEPARLGRVYAAETGFILSSDPDTVRAPDVAFISSERLPPVEHAGFSTVVPDLAVEVVSPDDRPGDLHAKVADWLNAGTRLIWVIDPGRRTARVHRDDGTESILGPSDQLEGESVLPGFRCALSGLW